MSDLFSDLYRYRERERKNNYEDWLTECLAAILRALPQQVFSEFMSRLTGQPVDAISEIFSEISVATQVTIERGTTGSQRPDMIISIAAPKREQKREPSQPWLLFENKVTHHVDVQELETGEIESQFHRYGSWLQQQTFARPELKQSLIFVSHHTAAPADFTEIDSKHPAYNNLERTCSTWAEIGCQLNILATDYDDRFHFCALISAYQAFLKDHGMDENYPEYRDYAALAGYVETVDSFSKLVNEMVGKLDGLAPFSGHVVWASANAEEGTFEAHRYLAPEKRFDGSTFLATGIWFPDRGEGLYSDEIQKRTGLPVSLAPKAYIQFANDKDNALEALKGIPDGDWYRFNSDLFTFRDIASFPPEPKDCALAILDWVETEGAKLKALLAS